MKRFCTVCGMANDDTASFCRGCGTPLAPVEAEERVLPFQTPSPPALGASRQKTFLRALLAGTGVAVAGGLALWWVADRAPPAPAQHAPSPPPPVPAVITPPPLVKPLQPFTVKAAVAPPPAAGVEKPHSGRKTMPEHRLPSASHLPQPVPPPPAPQQTAAPSLPSAPAKPQPASLAEQVAQCKAQYSGITRIIDLQRCLWRYCEGHWGQSGCPPKYGEDNSFN